MNTHPTPGSTQRHSTAPFKGQLGRCAWCGTTDLPKGRKSWCSQKCVDEYLMRSSSSHIRGMVYKRDKGICAICGCDATPAFREWTRQRKEVLRLANWLITASRDDVEWTSSGWRFQDRSLPSQAAKERFRQEMLAKYAPGRWTQGRSSGWDADHIVPVVEGGGECDLTNFRTLCHPCHKTVTAELASKRSRGRAK